MSIHQLIARSIVEQVFAPITLPITKQTVHNETVRARHKCHTTATAKPTRKRAHLPHGR